MVSWWISQCLVIIVLFAWSFLRFHFFLSFNRGFVFFPFLCCYCSSACSPALWLLLFGVTAGAELPKIGDR